jgi:diacylglycerol kinase (ATP)
MNFGGKLLENRTALEETPQMAPAMRRVALVDNPASGLQSSRREATVRAALGSLQSAGIEVEHLTIDGPGSGSALAREAMARGCDTVIVCGGDGTVHEVMQALVGTGVALGVVPMGTANALAANLGLKTSPEKAIRRLLNARPVQVPVGRIFYRTTDGEERCKYFTVAAGVGADALLMARMDPVRKRKWGYLLYVFEAFRIWATHPFPLFQARFTKNGNGRPQVAEASQILVVRVRSFGGLLGTLAPGATLHSDSLCLLAFKTRSRFRYLRFLLAVIGQRHTFSRDVELLKADTVECMPANGSSSRVYVEADGDVLGHLPARIEIAPEMLTLLIPPDAQP